MSNEKFIFLIHKKLKNLLSSQEVNDLHSWKSASNTNQQVEKDLTNIWNASDSYKASYIPDVAAGWNRLQTKMHTEKRLQIRSSRRIWLGRIAASLFLLLMAGGIGYYFFNSTPSNMLSASTTKGQQKTIQLYDGSSITLNENASLQYPEQFDSNERTVQLTGEAFFDITHKPQQPFLVKTSDAVVKVLGTSFNVHTNGTTNQLEVAVATGKVQVQSKQSKTTLILTNGEVGILDITTDSLHKSNRTAINSSSWKTQKLHFKKTPLLAALQDIERHFHTSIQLENQALADCVFTSLHNKPNLPTILNSIAATFGMTVNQKGQTYVLTGGQCE